MTTRSVPPASPASPAAAPAVSSGSGASSSIDERPSVLVVDDEKFIRDILADFLGMEGTSSAPPKTAPPR